MQFFYTLHICQKKLPTSGVGPPTFRLQGERNNHYATQASVNFEFREIEKIYVNEDFYIESSCIN